MMIPTSQREYDRETLELAAVLAREESWPFLKYFTYTQDEHDASITWKQFPLKAYVRIICRLWDMRDLYPIVFIEKSRQTIFTWTTCALLARDTIMLPNRRNFLQDKKEEDAGSTLERVEHILEKLYGTTAADGVWPFETGPYALPEPRRVSGRFRAAGKIFFPEIKSGMYAIPQGPNIVRKHTCSNIFSDEIAFQRQADEAYAAAGPTLDRGKGGGGRFWAPSTPNGKVFNYCMLYNIDPESGEETGTNSIDSRLLTKPAIQPPAGLGEEQARMWIERAILDMTDEEFNDVPIEELAASMPGMAFWVTSLGVAGLRLHYSADPEKSPETEYGREWIKNARIGKPPDTWQREYEIRYDTFQGRKVIANWDDDTFCKRVEYDCRVGIRIGIDFGAKFAYAVIGQYVPVPGYNAFQLRFLSEIVLKNSTTWQLAKLLKEHIKLRYPQAYETNDIVVNPDPAGHQPKPTTSDSSLNTEIKILEANGFRCETKKLSIRESTEVVKGLFATLLPDGRPMVVVNRDCEYLQAVLGFGWHYPKDVRPGTAEDKPEKDGVYEHGGDGVRYLVCACVDPANLLGSKKKRSRYVRVKQRHHLTGAVVIRRVLR